MALQPRQFFLDVQSRQFVGGIDNRFAPVAPAFFEEDVEAVELYFVQPASSTTYQVLDLSAATVKFAVGITAPAALQTAWTPIATTITTSVSTSADGGSGNDEVQRIDFSRKATSGGYIVELPARSVSVQSVSAGVFTTTTPHGFFNGQPITLTGFSTPSGFSNGDVYYVINRTDSTFSTAISAGGSYLTEFSAATGVAQLNKITTGQIPYNASPGVVQAAFTAVSTSVAVTGVAGEYYVLTYTNESGGINFAPVIVTSSTLTTRPGLQANISFATQEIADAIAAGTTNMTLEVEVSEGGVRQTFQQRAVISNDIISSTSPSPLPAVTATNFQLQDSGGTVWTISVTPSGELMIAQ